MDPEPRHKPRHADRVFSPRGAHADLLIRVEKGVQRIARMAENEDQGWSILAAISAVDSVLIQLGRIWCDNADQSREASEESRGVSSRVGSSGRAERED